MSLRNRLLLLVLLFFSVGASAGVLGDLFCGKSKLLQRRELLLKQIESEKKKPENLAISICSGSVESYLDSKGIGYTSVSATYRGATKQYIGVGVLVRDSTDQNFSVVFACTASVDGSKVLNLRVEEPHGSARLGSSIGVRTSSNLDSLEVELIHVNNLINGC